MYSQIYARLKRRTGENSWSSSYVTNLLITNPTVDVSLGASKNTFKISVHDPTRTLYSSSDYFRIGDLWEFYLLVNGASPSTSNLLMVGRAEQVQLDTSNGTIYNISGHDNTASIFGALAYVSGSSMDSMEVIQQALSSVQGVSEKFNVYWDSSNNPTTKKDGSAFPKHEVSENYVSLNMILQKYLGAKYTEDGDYFYWVETKSDGKQYLRVAPISSSSESVSASLVDGVDFDSTKCKLDTSKVKNAFVAYLGQDPKTHGIIIPYFNWESIAKVGFKWQVVSDLASTAQELMVYELNNNPSSFSSGGGWYPDTYPYTTAWKSTESDSSSPACSAGSSVTINSDSEYVAAVRREARWRGLKKLKQYADFYGDAKVVVDDIVVKPRSDVRVGSLVSVTIPRYNLNSHIMRVERIVYKEGAMVLTVREENPSKVSF